MSTKMGGAKPTTDFELCPPGPQQLVCCDVMDHGLVMTRQYGNQPPKEMPKVTIRWQSSLLMRDGRPYIVQKRYTRSSHVKATLRKDLEAWRGKPFTDQEADDFDLERLIGVNCFANIVHMQKPRGIFAEVTSIMPRPRNLPKLEVRAYTRVSQRDATQPPGPTPAGQPPAPHQPPSNPQPAPQADDFPTDDLPEPGSFDGPDDNDAEF